MSHIFDALQRSEAERTGVDLRALSEATELLEIAERRAGTERETAVHPEHSDATEIAERETPVSMQALPSLATAAEASVAAEHPLNDNYSDEFGQFQSLKILVPPQSRLVCVTDKESLAAEKFRFLGVRLRQLRQNRQLKKVLITSTIPQEGKSMVAANLACTLARRAQQKTLLLDGDLRQPSLAQLFGLGTIPGMSEWLQRERGPMTSIYYLEGPGLWILPAGSSPRNSLELLQSGRFPVLMDQLTTWFDWIVIDSPPVLPLADTSVWTRLADGILLVTRQGITEKQQLQRGLEAIEQSKLIGALLNCSANTAHSDYYYHYRPPTDSKPNGDSTK
jgi:capsular exopolysaccharide synthesis family protein